MKSKTVLVIGAGIGGMVAATYLARTGMQVTVVEKNAHSGGRCDQVQREGHTFDTGPTLLVMPHLYESEFNALGTSLRDQLDLQRVDPTYHLVFDDDSRLALTSDMQSLEDQMQRLEPGSYHGLLRYLAEGQRHYDLGIPGLVRRDFRKAGDFLSLKNLPMLLRMKPLTKHYRHMGAFFANPRLRSAFTFQDVYMGLSPFEAPATFSLMPYSELAHGVWFPRGGMYSLAVALEKLARQAGVKFVFNSEVDHIEVQGNRVTGILSEDGKAFQADIMLANADLPYVYKALLPQDGMNKTLARKKYSCSVISFFWGLDKAYPSLPPHTLFLADDYRQNFISIQRDLDMPSNPSMYIHAPARLDPAMSPPGQDTVTAIVPVGHMNEEQPQDWEAIRDSARSQVFRRLRQIGVNDLEAHIKFEISYTPASWQNHYNLIRGATHGLAHTLLQLAWFRPHNRHARYPNLYFAGASTHPGTGLPTAMVSGRLAAERLLDDLKRE
jgi:phytoene desaturase